MSQSSREDNRHEFSHFQRPQGTTSKRTFDVSRPTEARPDHSNRSDSKPSNNNHPLDLSKQSSKVAPGTHEPQETPEQRRKKILEATEARIRFNRPDNKNHITPPLDISKQSLRQNERQRELEARRRLLAQAAEARRDNENNQVSLPKDTSSNQERTAVTPPVTHAHQGDLPSDSSVPSPNNTTSTKEMARQAIERMYELDKNNEPYDVYAHKNSIYIFDNIDQAREKLGKKTVDHLKTLDMGESFNGVRRIDPDDALNRMIRGARYESNDDAQPVSNPERQFENINPTISDRGQKETEQPKSILKKPGSPKSNKNVRFIEPERTSQPASETQPPEALRREGSRTRDNAQNMASESQPIRRDLTSEPQAIIRQDSTDGSQPTRQDSTNEAQQMQYIAHFIQLGYDIIDRTRAMPFEQRLQIQQRWLDSSIPQPLRNLIERMTMGEIHEEEHRNRMRAIIQKEKLNIQIPNQKTALWADFAANFISDFEDEHGLGKSHILGDILQGGTRIEDSWHEIRNSSEYKTLTTQVLKEWKKWPGREQQERQERSRSTIDQPTLHTSTVNEQVLNRQMRQSLAALDMSQISEINANPHRQSPATIDTPKSKTEIGTASDSPSSAALDIPKPSQETQKEEQNEDNSVPLFSENATDGDTKGKKKREKNFLSLTGKYKRLLSDYTPKHSDETEKPQRAQELEHIQQKQQEFERIQQEQKEQEYFLYKLVEEFNKFLAKANEQAKLKEFEEQRAREMQEMDAKAREISHLDTRGEISGY